jgi:hypothetical protein
MKRIIIFCLIFLVIYVIGVVAINLPQKAAVVKQDSTITVPTPSSTQPTSSQKPNVNL